MDLTVVSEEDLRRRFGTPTYERASAYLHSGRVLSSKHETDSDGDLVIKGQVQGSRGVIYTAYVSTGLDADGVWYASRCDCPVQHECKHVLALVMEVRAIQAREHAAAGRGPNAHWEHQLTTVLDELDDAADRAGRVGRRTPLALQVALSRQLSKNSWRAPTSIPSRGTLQIRPLQRGARDNWIKSGVSFQDLTRMRGEAAFDPDQLALLNELAAVHQAASRYGYYHGSEPHLTLATFGPALWATLGRVKEAGIPLVPGPGLTGVHLLPEPVRVELDVNATDEHAHLRLGVQAEQEWYAADAVDLLGDPGHGVALWSPSAGGASWVVTLAALDKPLGPQLRRLFSERDDLVVPAGARDELVTDYLPRLQRHVPVISSDGSIDLPERPEPRLALSITWVSVSEVELVWTWRYAVGGTDRVYGLTETRGLRNLRRPELEVEAVLALGRELTDHQVFALCDSHRLDRGLVERKTFEHDQAIGFVDDVLPTLETLASQGLIELEETGGRPDYRAASGAPVISFTSRDETDAARAKPDWLDLEVTIQVEGQYLALAALLEALTLGQPRVIMPNGLHVEVDRPEFAHLAELVEAASELHEQPRDGVRVGHRDLNLWEELAEVGIVDEQAAQWVRAAEALRDIETLPSADLVGVKAELRPYQLDGFRWLAFLWQSRLGGILADDMGLGKTLQTLALVAHAREAGSGPFLVVAPTSVVSTWAHEAEAFTPGLVVRTVTSSVSRRGDSIASLVEGADIVITSYTLLRLEIDAYAEQAWGGLVLDEAQTVKNHTAKTYQSVRRIETDFRLALTGTPMENRLMELWSLLSIVAPGLYAYPARFKELVADPVEKEGDQQALDRFRRRIRPFLLRRTKDLVAADLPPKQEQVLEVELTPRHRRIYDTHLQRERQTVLGLVEEDFEKHRIAIFRSLTKLRQLSLDAALVDEAYESAGSAKVDVLIDHLTEIVEEGHKVLVFSQFTSFLARVRERLDRAGITLTYLDGSTTRRGEVIDSFKTGEAAVFLISLKAGGVGLTLTEADYVFVLDPWWNPAVEAQAVDRAHRIGQTKPVMVYRLVSTGTIEEKVMELKARKAALFSQVIDGDGSSATPIDADDVRALFTS
jgi:superfamily II DNA or RNA helicase